MQLTEIHSRIHIGLDGGGPPSFVSRWVTSITDILWGLQGSQISKHGYADAKILTLSYWGLAATAETG